MDPTQPPPQQPLQTPVQIPDFEPKPNYLKTIIFFVLAMVTLGLIAYLIFQNQKLQKQVLNPPVSPTIQAPSPTPKSVSSISLPPDETAGWKTYTNYVRNYSIEYPDDWKIDTSQAETPINNVDSAQLIIFQGEYRLNILWPSAFGPGICMFDDQSRVGAPEVASYCEGKFVEIISKDEKNVYRRLEKPELTKDRSVWAIYNKSKDLFVTVPPTNYSSPLTYDQNTILIMDQILSTFKFTGQETNAQKWPTYTNEELRFSINYPNNWRVVDSFVKAGFVGFGPKEIREDTLWGIAYYKKSDFTLDKVVNEAGSQFSDRKQVKNLVSSGSIATGTKIITTTPSHPDWYYVMIIYETVDGFIAISNGAIKDENLPFDRGVPNGTTFEQFYSTFKFTN